MHKFWPWSAFAYCLGCFESTHFADMAFSPFTTSYSTLSSEISSLDLFDFNIVSNFLFGYKKSSTHFHRPWSAAINFQYFTDENIDFYYYWRWLLVIVKLSPKQAQVLSVWSTNLLKTLWEKEKFLVRSAFYLFGELCDIFNKFEIVVCKLFQFGRVKIVLFGKEINIRWRAVYRPNFYLRCPQKLVSPLGNKKKYHTTK